MMESDGGHLVNAAKMLVHRFYISYRDHVPFQKGKGRLGKVLHDVVGPANYEIDGMRFCLSPFSALDNKLITNEPHDQVVRDQIHLAFSGRQGTFVDVGANIGYFSILAATKYGANVLAFEPSPRELAFLYQHLVLNRCGSRVVVFPLALSDKTDSLELNICEDHNPGMNSIVDLSFVNTYKEERVAVRGVTFDSLFSAEILSSIRLIKIDVEGYEVFVLRGMEQSLKVVQDCTFVVEISRGYLNKINCSVADIYDVFERHGYHGVTGRNDEREQYDEVFVK